MKIYAMSDIHGCLKEFEAALSLVDLGGDNMLILLGDYIHGSDDYGVLDRVIELQNQYGNKKVVALLGNHEEHAIDGISPIGEDAGNTTDVTKEKYRQYIHWMKGLPRFYSTEHQIFVHAGVAEEAYDLWRWGTADYIFTGQFPAKFGKFYMDIIAGHTGTSSIAGNPDFNGIYYDGESHYYIDGSVLRSRVIPVILVDTEKNKYYRVDENGTHPIVPYIKPAT